MASNKPPDPHLELYMALGFVTGRALRSHSTDEDPDEQLRRTKHYLRVLYQFIMLNVPETREHLQLYVPEDPYSLEEEPNGPIQ